MRKGTRTRAGTPPLAGIPRTASTRVDAEHVAFMWSLSPAERQAAARRGEFSLGEMLTWAARYPHEVELVDGEFWFLTVYMAEYDDG